MRTLSRLSITLLLAVQAFAQDKPMSDSKAKVKAKAKDDAAVHEAGATGFDTIGSMIPEGVKNLKVRIPGFEAGRITSLIFAKSMTRVNPQELFAEEMVIHLYQEDKKGNVQVDLRTGTYHMDTKLLTSQQRSKVSRSDFQIEGDTMVFDTTTSQGKMTGRVHMIIYDSSSMAPKKKEAAASTTSQPDNADSKPK